jgi:hypothetical protein
MRAFDKKFNLTLGISAIAIACGTMSAPAVSADCAWNAGAGVWNSAGNWTCGFVPGGGDNVSIINVGGIVSMSGINAFAGTLTLGATNALNVSASNLFIQNQSITNNGIITLANAGDLRSNNGVVTVGGTGTFVLDDTLGAARIFSGGFIFGSGQTVRGSGNVGLNQTVISNAGLFSANVNGRTLSLDASGGNGGVGAGNGFGTNGNAGFYNSGILEATGGGTLSFEGGLYENGPGGLIRALNGSVVRLGNDSRIVGGTLSSTGTGVVSANGVNAYLTNTTLSAASTIDVVSANLRLNGSFVNNGTLNASVNSDIIAEGPLSISGTGSIQLDNSSGNARLYASSITFASNHAINGSGNVGINQTILTNNGTLSFGGGGGISLDVSGGNGGVGAGNGVGTNGNSGMLNSGIVSVIGGSTLYFEGGLYEGGIFRALGGSTIALRNDARMFSTTLTSDGTSIINAHGANQYLQNVILSGGSRLDIDASNLRLNTLFTNNGTVTAGHNADIINEGGLLTIAGSGTIVMDNSAGNARMYGGTITFGAGQTLQGSGQLGLNQTILVINNVFSANAGTTLSIDASGGNGGVGVGNGVGVNQNSGLLNNSIIETTGGSVLSFEGGRYENSAGGIFRALTGSSINLNNDVRIVGGTLTTVGTGVIKAHGANQYLQEVTLSSGSHLDVDSDNLRLNTSFVNSGLMTIGHNADVINEGGLLTLRGNGVFQLDNSTGYARIYGGHIMFGSNLSLTGSGQLGLNQTILTNNGIFSISNGGNLSIDAAGGNGGVGVGNGVGTNANSGMLNNGVVEAGNASSVSFEGGLYEGGIFRALGGSSINLNNDARLLNVTLVTDAGSLIKAFNANQYLQNVTLSAGSDLAVDSDNLRLNTLFTNNGTTTIGHNADLITEGAAVTIAGSGSIVLDNSTGHARIYSGKVTVGSGQAIRCSGQFGLNQTLIVNEGLISGDVVGGGISIDVSGGNGGVGAGNGVGPSTNAGLYNTGTIRAFGGSTLALEGGRYDNDAAGTLAAIDAGSTFLMNGDSNLTNLLGGNVLSLGTYISSTTGAASTLNLRGTGAASIATIGTGVAGTDTIVRLSGIASALNVTNFGSGVNTALDSSLTGIAQSGRLELLDGRSTSIVAGGGAFSNAGVLQLGGGIFGASNFTNSGLTTGFGTISLAIANSGIVEAVGGTLATRAITGTTGTIRSLSGATLDLSAAAGNSTAGFLTNGGSLDIGARNVTVTSDYQNASFGSGNAFDAHGSVAGSGLLLASSATMDLSGPALSGGVLNVGDVRTGGSSSTILTITNNGLETILRGAVQNDNAPSIQLSSQNWVLNPNGGSTDITISYTGNQAGTLNGQTIDVVNNFYNVADQTLQIEGNIYQVAQAGSLPATIALQARRVGGASASSLFDISNVAPVTPGFNEALLAEASVGGPFRMNGLSALSTTVEAGNSTPVTLSLGTGAAGAFANVISIANTSLAVAGSTLDDLALAGQTINVTGNVYATAVAGLSGNSVNFGTVRQGSADPSLGLNVANNAVGALTDQLLTTAGAMPAGVSASTPGALNAGQSNQAIFTLDTAVAGVVSGAGSLNFASHNAEMSDLSLGAQTVTFSGTVTELATASLFKNGGDGAFGGSGSAYTLNFGTLTSDSGFFTVDLGVLNGNSGEISSEVLGGAFALAGSNPFSFAGNIFSDVAGGASNVGNFLRINTAGLGAGAYSTTLTFNGYSRYPGLSDLALTPIKVTINAQIQGGGGGAGAVPEPSTWAMMILGFGVVGTLARRRKVAIRFS